MAVRPIPPAALLQACVDPSLPDPDAATDRDVALAVLDLGKAYYDCKRRHADLAAWVRAK